MAPDVERTIIQYYPKQALVSPLDDRQIVWDYDADNSGLRALVAALEAVDPALRNGTRGRYDISEELILFDQLRLQICYLGPYAALNYGVKRALGEEARDRARQIREILDSHGITLLSEAELEETVPWILHPKGARADVWSCLFVHPEA